MKLYVRNQNKIIGPLDWSRIEMLLNTGKLPQDAQFSEDKLTWLSASDIKQLIQGKSESAASQEKIRLVKPEPSSGSYQPEYPPMPPQAPMQQQAYMQQPGYQRNEQASPQKSSNAVVIGCGVAAAVVLLLIIAVGGCLILGGIMNNEVSVEVTVKAQGVDVGDTWKDCEYKLYADGVCIATKEHIQDMDVTFHVTVEKGAELKAELYPKNGFGVVLRTIHTEKVRAKEEKQIIYLYYKVK